MTAATSAPSGVPDVWVACGHGADTTTGSEGCLGVRVPGHPACLAHLDEPGRSTYLAGLVPGADLDHRHTPLTEGLLRDLLNAVRDPTTGRPCIGEAFFDFARISGNAPFQQVDIRGDASFTKAEIEGDVRFDKAKIDGTARFDQVQVNGDVQFPNAQIGLLARFGMAQVGGDVWFEGARIGGDASFIQSRIGGTAWFTGVEFGGIAMFAGTTIGGDVHFTKTEFERTASLGPLACTGTLVLSRAVFHTAVTIEAAATTILCRRTRWAARAWLRLRHAAVDVTDAVWEYPVSISAHTQPFSAHGIGIPESGLTDPRVRVMSLQGVDAAHLVLTDVDLSRCQFAGTIHLDQLRVEGRCPWAAVPAGLHRNGALAVRWTPRRTLAEEQHWRAGNGAVGGWAAASQGQEILEPAALAPVYRQLRKAFEDGKDEPGAADFYYGEMEMRRHDRETPRAERALLGAYWALSGYGLRASRAVGWLLSAMTITVLVMMLWGLPKDDPRPWSTGTVDHGRIALRTDTPDPVNPDSAYRERLSSERFEKSLRVVINSVIFRSSGQDLTTTGTYTEMIARLTEPVLLGLAVLAVRSRIKR